MPGWFDNFVKENSADILSAEGNIEDYIRLPKTLEESQKILNNMQLEHDKTKKFWDISNKLQGIDYDTVPTTKKVDGMELDPEHPDFKIPDKSENPAVIKYRKYVADHSEKDAEGKPLYDGEALDFKTYLDKNPDLKAYIGEQHYRKKTDEVALTPEEYKLEAYKGAGLNDNDIKFYDENKSSIDNITDYNQKVQNMLLGMYPNLISRKGKMGDMYGKIAEQRGQNLMINEGAPVKHKFGFKDVGGKVLKYDEGTGNYKVLDIDSNKKKSDDPGNWEHFIDEDGSKTGEKGKVYWGIREKNEKTGNFEIKYMGNLNEQEQKDYQNDEDKKNKEGVYTPKTGTGRRSGSRRSKESKIGDMKPEDFKKVRAGDLKNMDVADIDQLKKYKKYLNPSVQDELDKVETDGKPNDAYTDESDPETFKYFDKYANQLDAEKDKDKWHSLQESFLADLEKYKGKLSQNDYEDFYNSYYKY